jgi:hypothetical protein
MANINLKMEKSIKDKLTPLAISVEVAHCIFLMEIFVILVDGMKVSFMVLVLLITNLVQTVTSQQIIKTSI